MSIKTKAFVHYIRILIWASLSMYSTDIDICQCPVVQISMNSTSKYQPSISKTHVAC